MSRATPAVFVASLLAAAALVGCSKADSKPAPSAPPSGDGARGEVATGAGVPRGPIGMAPAGEGAVPADKGAAEPDDSFAIAHEAVAGTVGENVARIVVTPGKGFHMNKDYPTKLTLELPAGVTSPKGVLEPADAEAFTDNKLVFAVKLTAASKGDYTIPAVLKFAVCTDSTCDPKKQKLALSLKAQ